MKSRKRRYALAALLATIVATAGFAFAASNTVPTSYAGEGSGTISGFTASAIHYTLDSANPASITGVQFSLSPTPGSGATVKAALDAGAYVACTSSAGTWSCPVTGTVLAAASLKVVAAD